MARGRILSRTIATDGRFNKLTIVEQWLFMRLLPFADDHGRLPGNLIELRLLCIPGSTINNADLEDALIRLDELELIYYDKGRVIQYRSWLKNQKLNHKPAESVFPNPRQYTKTKEREPEKIKRAVKSEETNFNNVVITFEDFWNIGFKKTDRKKCMAKWTEIPDEQKLGLKRFAERYVKGKKGLQNPYTFLALKKWEKEIVVSTNPKDFTQITDGVYRAYCSVCGNEVYPSALELSGVSVCCDAPLSPDRPLPKIHLPKLRNLE